MKKHVVIYGLNVGGMKAALDLGMGGYSVLMLNRGNYIAHNPTQLLAYDPTNITNGYLMKGVQMVPTIDIWHGIELEEVASSDNGVHVKVKRTPPDVEPAKCVECGLCVEKGMKYTPRPIGGIYEFPEGISDEQKKEIQSACPFGAINVEKQPEVIDIDADVFIIASEFSFDKQKLASYGVGKVKGVWPISKVHRLFFGVGQHSQFLKDDAGNDIKRLALVDVDSINGGSYFNYVSFLSLLKFALAVKGVAKDVDIDIYYNLPNFYAKSLVGHIKEARDRGVKFIKYNADELSVADGPSVMGNTYDVVGISYPEVAPNANKYIANKLGIELKNGYFETQPGMLETELKRVFVVGEAHESKSNSDAMRDGDVAALEAFGYLTDALKAPKMPSLPDYDEVDPVYGALLCRCGIKYQNNADSEKIEEYAKEIFDHVEVSDFLCLDIQKKAKVLLDKGVNRLAIGACTMSVRGGFLIQMAQMAGLDASYIDLVQLKEFGKSEDVQKSILKRSRAVLTHRKKSDIPVDTNVERKALVIGDSVASLTAALSIARAGLPVTIFVKNTIKTILPEQSLLINKLKDMENVKILENGRISKIDGYGGHYTVYIELANDEIAEESAGVILFGPSNYKIPDTKSVDSFNHVGIIIGSINNSTSSARYEQDIALRFIKEIVEKGKKVTVGALITAFRGRKLDEWVSLLKENKLELVFAPEMLGDEAYKYLEEELKKKGADVVMHIAPEFSADYDDIIDALQLRRNDDGTIYYLEDPYDDGNIKMVSGPMVTKGIFITGPLRKPMSPDEEMLDGQSEAMKMLAVIAQPAMMAPGMRMISFTNTRKCAGCALCVEACHYGARFIDTEDNVAKVREVLCEGCAACVSACPSGAAEVKMLEAKQMLQSITTLLSH